MESIFCESPVIILNSAWVHYIASASYINLYSHNVKVTPELKARWINFHQSFSYQFSPKLNGVTIENMDDCYILIASTGEMIPLYIQVPCNKCVLCRKRKTSEWKFRAVCENATSTSEPLFITLTYNQEHLPSIGIYKEEIQLFLKRIRRNLDRMNVEHHLRYFACGEYGHNSQRPHYHMILWNFPDKFTNLFQKLKVIEDAWRAVVTDEEGNILYNEDGSPVTESIGFCYVKPLTFGGIEYVMKYMKKAHTPPTGMNPCFFLSSRREGGIGAKYAKSLMQFYRDNPQCTTISCRDPFTGKLHERESLPSYFKRLYFPSVSQYFPKLVTDSYKKLCHSIKMYNEINYILMSRQVFPDGRSIADMYQPYHYLQDDIDMLKIYNFVGKYYHPHVGDYKHLWKLSSDKLVEMMHDYSIQSIHCKNILKVCVDDVNTYRQLDDAKHRLQSAMYAKFDGRPKQDIKELKEHEFYLLEKEYMKEIL